MQSIEEWQNSRNNPVSGSGIQSVTDWSSTPSFQAQHQNSFGTIIKEAAQRTVSDFIPAVVNPLEEAAKNTWNIYSQFPSQFASDFQNSLKAIANTNSSIKNSGDQGNKLGAAVDSAAYVGNILMPLGDVANAIFAPMSAAFGSALQNSGAQSLIDQVGNTIADKSGITDLPKFQNYAAQHPDFARKFNNLLMLFTVGTDEYKSANAVPEKIVNSIQEIAQSTIDNAKVQETPEAPAAMTPTERQAAYAKSMGYEPYTPHEQLPTIDAGKPLQDSLPTIQIGDSVKLTRTKTGSYTYEPIPDQTQAPAPAQTQAAPTPSLDGFTPPVRELTPEGTQAAKAASDINATLVQKGFDALSPEQQAQYTPGSYADDAKRVTNIMDTDMNAAKAMATGDVPMSPAVKYPQILFNAIEAKATADGDVDLLQKLAKSPLAAKTSEAGATLGSHGFNDNPNSVVDTIRDISNSRTAKAEKATGTNAADVVKEAKTAENAAVKSGVTKQSWSDFIEQIKCNY